MTEGFNVEWHRSGRQVIASLRTQAFAAAVLDLGLPDVDGVELCRELRSAAIDTPVLMLTARATLEDRLEGFDGGADDYLTKPFAFSELVARLGALVRRGEVHRSRVLLVGALTVDVLARLVTVGTSALLLSRREFDLLSFLAARAGVAVRRDVIMDGVWGEDTDVTENAVDVYIGYLRRKLAGLPGVPTIDTVRGVGFRMSPVVLKDEAM
ncbi:response regulator transcription factor [Sphingobium sp. SCG-1]|uniref:response regulator transcription factor n=1 Tax=Sphingobium sp. SCG-1 TaxID=2072936 RepID=UPI0021D53979|nr:response regulator transcription factor [Sphingobium sp. SCG-1]